MKILFVAMSESIHVARWINQLVDQPWELHIFPAGYYSEKINSQFKGITVHDWVQKLPQELSSLETAGDEWLFSNFKIRSQRVKKSVRKTLWKIYPQFRNRAWRLAKTIKKLNPDIVQAIELQHAGALVYEAYKFLSPVKPPLVCTNFGSDIYLFARLAAYRQQIVDLLSICNYYACECERDVILAQKLGYKGKVLPILPNAGGVDMDNIQKLRSQSPPSKRKVIAVKGYQNWSGRALVALRAVNLCKEYLTNFEIVVYSASDDIKIAIELTSLDTGLSITTFPPSPHEEMLRLFGRSRIYIGLNITDGVSTSCLEALSMGAFPIQSATACIDEWVSDGENGFIVPAEDPERIAQALKTALLDDALVDRADKINQQITRNRLDTKIIAPQVIDYYEQIQRREI